MTHKPSVSLNIGTTFTRDDAYGKVTGTTKFASDFYSGDMVWAGAKRAGIPHAVINEIKIEKARNISGVIDVLTSADIPGINKQGVVRKDQPVLAADKIRHCGDAVALVIAESKESLELALQTIELDCSSLPGIFDMEEAITPGSPLVHEDNPKGNILIEGHLNIGKGMDAEKDCDYIVEGIFNTPRQEHAYLETECGWAEYQSGRLTITCSTQTPFRDRMETSEVLNLKPQDIRIIAPYMGGAFGGKDGVTVQTLLGLAALRVPGRPVKMWWSREESFVSGTKRHAAKMYYKLGAKKDMALHYLEVRLYLDTGPYDHLGGVVLSLALEHAGGPYRIPNAVVDGWAIYTNNPIGGAFRGFGVPQVTAAIEQCVDMLASKMSVDPLEFRLKNAVQLGDKIYVGKTLSNSTGVIECIRELAGSDQYTTQHVWKAGAKPGKLRGTGVAAVMQASGYGPMVPDVGNAKVELTLDGNIRVYCGVADMGQGNSATCLQIAGTILNQHSGSVEIVLPDTDRSLPSGSASAGRCTYTFGNALIIACRNLDLKLRQRASDFLMCNNPERLAVLPGRMRDLQTGIELPLNRLAAFLDDSERIAVGRWQAPQAPEDLKIPDDLRLHGLPHTMFSFGAHFAAVEVDAITGQVSVEDYFAIHTNLKIAVILHEDFGGIHKIGSFLFCLYGLGRKLSLITHP